MRQRVFAGVQERPPVEIKCKDGPPRKAGPTKGKKECKQSELAFEIELEAAAGVSRGGRTKIGIYRAAVQVESRRDTNERDVVRMIEDIENIESRGKHRAVFFLFLEMEVVGDVDVEVQQSRTVQCIAGRKASVQAVVEYAVAVRVESRCDVHGFAGVGLKRDANAEET